MVNRPRRLRTNQMMRDLTKETRISEKALIYPVFVQEGENICEEISSLYDQKRYSPDRLPFVAEQALQAGVNNLLLFGIPVHKDLTGSGAYDRDGVVQKGIREIKKRFPQMQIVTDVCLCEYTSHGHCGILKDHNVDNDATLPYLAQTALSHVEAGADMVAPSDMMDGRVKAIRELLDQKGYEEKGILSYSVKYASSFYGPFREAAGSAPSFGDRKSYQMDYHNKREAIKEVLLDLAEGADMVMVKPALAYLDIVSEVKRQTNVPVAAYSVSGEYAMIHAAAQAGLIDRDHAFCELAVSIFRAGADILITYQALELAKWIKEGRIG